MNYKGIRFYENNEQRTVECSQIIMGSGDFLREDNMENVTEIFDQYVLLGGNVFDTARHYRSAERAIGLWLKEKKKRDTLFIETKCCHPVRENLKQPRVNPDDIERDLLTSLKMLDTNYVDFLALHRDDPNQPVGPLMQKFNALERQGLIKAAGVSNWSLQRMQEAQNYCLTMVCSR